MGASGRTHSLKDIDEMCKIRQFSVSTAQFFKGKPNFELTGRVVLLCIIYFIDITCVHACRYSQHFMDSRIAFSLSVSPRAHKRTKHGSASHPLLVHNFVTATTRISLCFSFLCKEAVHRHLGSREGLRATHETRVRHLGTGREF